MGSAYPYKHRKESPDSVYLRIASKQYGAISRSQLLVSGLSPHGISRRVREGSLTKVYRGVYAVGGAPPSWHQDITAAQLWAGEGAAFSHRTAAVLHALDVIAQRPIDVSLPRWKRPPDPSIRLHTCSLESSDLKRIGPWAVTSVARTLIDLGASVPSETVDIALDSALRRGLTSIPYLARKLDQTSGRGRRGVGVLRQILMRRNPSLRPVESPLETQFTRFLRKNRFPSPVPQFEVRHDDRFVARVDFAYPEKRILIELDSVRHHSSISAWRRDVSRRNELTARGWRVIHVTAEDLRKKPDETASFIRKVLSDRDSE